MDVNNPFNEMMTAERLSNEAIIHGMQVGTIQPFVGYSILDKRTKEAKQRELVRAAMQQGAGGPPPTVGQQVMQAADQVTRPGVPPAPTLPATDRQRPAPSMGIEAARSNMPEEYAGGGIVAFAEGGDTPWYDRAADWWYENVNKRASEGVDKGADWWHENVVTPASEYMHDKAYDTIMSGNRRVLPQGSPEIPRPDLKVVRPQAKAGPSAGIKSIDMAPAPAAVNQALSPDTSLQDALAESRKSREDLRDMITGQSSGDADKLRQLQGMSMLQAGLGIASGGSPWFSRNLAGALPAVESYQKGLDQLDTAKQARVKQLVDLGLKGEELDKALIQLGITKDYYDAHKPLIQAQAREAEAKGRYYDIEASMYPQIQQAKIAAAGARAARSGSSKPPKLGASAASKLAAMEQEYLDNPLESPQYSRLSPEDQMALTGKAGPANQEIAKRKHRAMVEADTDRLRKRTLMMMGPDAD